MINETTHIKEQNPTSEPDLYATSGTIMTNASEYFYTFSMKEKHNVIHDKSEFKERAYSKITNDNFISNIENHDWT